MQVTTAPVRNAAGEMTSGVEIFQDVSSILVDFDRAEKIQSQNTVIFNTENATCKFDRNEVTEYAIIRPGMYKNLFKLTCISVFDDKQ